MTQNAVAKKDVSQSERFMNMVVSNFSTGVGEVALTAFQKRLAQNYFISLDASLKLAEEKRQKKRGNNQEQLPVIWQNVNMDKLARDVVAYARIGFDPAQKNHINMVPFKNNTTGKYDITFVEGYRGMELKAVKYGLHVPDNIIVEVVYSTDRFKSFKKDRNNKFDDYEFEIKNEFDRGTVVGGFYYHAYYDTPEKNKLVTMSLKDIEKRKPQYASVEFWGGEKDIWDNGKKVGKEQVEGWYEKMVWKTIYRAAHGDVTIDSQKIDDDYMRLRQVEAEFAEADAEQEIAENANRDVIDVTPSASPMQQPTPSDPPGEEEPSKKGPAQENSSNPGDAEERKPSIDEMELKF